MMPTRVLSGMRPTGELHLGHLCGVLDNWRVLQDEAECFFFIADWHALTTDYAAPDDLAAAARNMAVAWLAAGIDGKRTAMFVQSRVPEHAELHVLLSMLCPLSKLTQLPTYKEMRENLSQDLDTYGFLGYPLLQSADILAYRPDSVPVGEDQLPHVEFTREIARRVNRLYGGGEEFQTKVRSVLKDLPADARQKILDWRRRYQQSGEQEGLEEVLNAANVWKDGREARALLRGYCLYDAEEILPPPQALLTPAARLPGTDGRKMSKSYGNTIGLFEEPKQVENKIARMKTDPARQRRTDPGNPEECPVWEWHQQFSDLQTRRWAEEGCRSAGIGCLDCKKRLSEHINRDLQPLRDKKTEVEKSGEVDDILADGTRRARRVAAETLFNVRRAMRLLPAGAQPPAEARS